MTANRRNCRRGSGRLVISLAVLLIAAQCSEPGPAWRGAQYSPHESDAPVNEAAVPSPANTRPVASRGTGPVRVLGLAFEVWRIDLPVESVRHSRKIWNHVDESRIEPALAARLARNALRVGAVSEHAWPAIRTILQAAGATSDSKQVMAQNGLPLELAVGNVDDDGESIFSYGMDNRLSGNTFDAGKKLIGIDYAVHAELGGSIELNINFEIRHDRGMMTWERRDGIIRQVPATDRNVFTEIAAVITLNPDESLLIGPGEEADNPYLVGSRFFTRREGGDRFETLMCVTPVPYETRQVRRE